MNEERVQTLMGLEERLGWYFADIALLDNALTHRSFVNENAALARRDNERLEFLGDALIGLVVAHKLYTRFPHLPEGELTRLRIALVRTDYLARLAQRLHLGDHLLMGRGEEATGGRERPRNLAGALEALIGALFLDRGFRVARAYLLRNLGSNFEETFREWFHNSSQVFAKHPGFISRTLLGPIDGGSRYAAVVEHESKETFMDMHLSDDREELFLEVEPLVLGSSTPHFYETLLSYRK